ADLHAAAERPDGGAHGQHGAADRVDRRTGADAQPMADARVSTVMTSGLELGLTVPGRVSVAAVAEPGQVVGVTGPNGAGTASPLRGVAGLVPAVGEVRVDGRAWSGLAVRERAVGMAFQDQLLFPHLSALDNVAFGPRSAGASRAEARRTAQGWLDRF